MYKFSIVQVVPTHIMCALYTHSRTYASAINQNKLLVIQIEISSAHHCKSETHTYIRSDIPFWYVDCVDIFLYIFETQFVSAISNALILNGWKKHCLLDTIISKSICSIHDDKLMRAFIFTRVCFSYYWMHRPDCRWDINKTGAVYDRLTCLVNEI